MQYFIVSRAVYDENLREFESRLRSANAHRAAYKLATFLDFVDATRAGSSGAELLHAINQGLGMGVHYNSAILRQIARDGTFPPPRNNEASGSTYVQLIAMTLIISTDTDRQDNSAFQLKRHGNSINRAMGEVIEQCKNLKS